MANIPIWPGSSSFATGSTPFGFYDADVSFQADADKFSLFSSRRLGYPIVDVELQDLNFYAAFEQAITVYGNEIYAYQIKENYLGLEGANTSSFDITPINNQIVTPNMSRIISLTEQYGIEAGTGGNVDWKSGSFVLTASVQDYDLNAWASASGYETGDLEIKRVFFESTPAIVKFFDPYVGSGGGVMNLMDSFGWGNMSPSVNFTLMPLNYDLQIINQIEMNDQIRRSNFSFEIQNNKLRIFPIPSKPAHLYFQFLLKSERYDAQFQDGTAKITNIGNVPYQNPQYSRINSVGRSWIFEYALALCKEMLGYVRGKFDTIPIPGSDVKLNNADLISASNTEKEKLIENLRTYLDSTSRTKLLEAQSQQSEFKQKELSQVPFPIYIG
tara:strand:+ start:441 stop:1598 length:1158 start_codon:yes stop_codon:yes gene_type:complete